jgi:hypothetical protein
MKPFVELDCDNMSEISSKLMKLIQPEIDSEQEGWIFIDLKQVLANVPELLIFFRQHRLIPMDAAVIILRDDLKIHVDHLPVIAKINFPIANTKGWANRWYQVDLDSCPRVINEFGAEKESLSGLDTTKLEILGEIFDLSKPIVFNSRLAHSVDKINPDVLPRVVASFTFHNPPLDLLK